MVFSSTIFLIIFLPALLGIYYASPRKWKNGVLLLGSLIFYGFGEPKYLIIMITSILFNYIFGLIIGRYSEKGLWNISKAFLVINIGINISILASFKYGNHFADWVLPIGISFYTFQELSYIIDIYKGKVASQKNLVKYATYVALFPQLIAGPIVRYSDVEFALTNRKENVVEFAEGIRRFVLGLGKKVLLANQLGLICLEVEKMQSSDLAMATAWISAIAFTLQIYFDFSGYSDMAIGLGKMFGFDFLENFDYPYKSKSITEFWRRWHMSLGSWFREYVYIPLGGNKKGLARQVFNLAVVWALTGMWHGASFNFLAWGIYFGTLLTIEKLWLLKKMEKWPNICKHLYSLFAIIFGWVIFTNTNFLEMINMIKAMFGFTLNYFDEGSLYLLSDSGVLLILASVISIGVAKRINSSKSLIAIGLTTLIFIMSIAFLVSASYNPFLYFRF